MVPPAHSVSPLFWASSSGVEVSSNCKNSFLATSSHASRVSYGRRTRQEVCSMLNNCITNPKSGIPL
ncbi:hypothetical protein BJY00DRAFT_289410 [Aspergillus carlsbadensis]|nr:hypothetical protein BJY00DRAFT_289410 [Aspergillus carlsbadensis]